jgi:hypothetical protein
MVYIYAMVSRMPYIFLRLPFMTGQVVLDFDQSRFRHTPSFFLFNTFLNPFKKHVPNNPLNMRQKEI